MDQPAQNEVVVGSFVNKKALIEYIRRKDIQTVNLYCTAPPGWGDEDYLFAEHIKKLLVGQESDFNEIVAKLRKGSGLRLLQSKTEPASDFDFCLQKNRFNTILKRKKVPADDNTLQLVKV